MKTKGCCDVKEGGAVTAYALQFWWTGLDWTMQEQLRKAWNHPSGKLDRGVFSCGGSSAIQELHYLADRLSQSGKADLAMDLMISAVNAKVGYTIDPIGWSLACSWIADQNWRLGYESAARLRTDGIHNRHLELVRQYGELAATTNLKPFVQSGKLQSCQGLERVCMLYEIAGMFTEGCRLIRRLERSGLMELCEVGLYRDAFCLWPAWCREIVAIQRASTKRLAFAAARTQAIDEGRISPEAASVSVADLQRVARGIKLQL